MGFKGRFNPVLGDWRGVEIRRVDRLHSDGVALIQGSERSGGEFALRSPSWYIQKPLYQRAFCNRLGVGLLHEMVATENLGLRRFRKQRKGEIWREEGMSQSFGRGSV